jgi:hypothetical protein
MTTNIAEIMQLLSFGIGIGLTILFFCILLFSDNE